MSVLRIWLPSIFLLLCATVALAQGVAFTDSDDLALNTTGYLPGSGGVTSTDSADFSLNTTGVLPGIGGLASTDSGDFTLNSTGVLPGIGGVAYADSADFTLDTRMMVTTLADSGPGSLRAAVAEVNQVGAGTVITFAPNLTGSIPLKSELAITDDLSVLGPGPNVVTVNGSQTNRVFVVTSGNVSISGLTIANGAGGINNNANLSLSNCVIFGHFGNGTAAAPGNGIINGDAGTMSLINCTIASNIVVGSGPTFVQGAGINNSGTLGMTNCTVSGNATHSSGNNVQGGGIYNDGSLAVIGCTIASNTAANGTTTAKGGGIFSSAAGLSMGNSIVAWNISGSGNNTGPDVSGHVTSLGYNLAGKNDGSTGLTATGDQTGTVAAPLDPLLGPLQDNGGGTLTHALLAGSPAIDAGTTFGVTFDQRGFPRPYTNTAGPFPGDGSDIGAYEVEPTTVNLTVNVSGPGAVIKNPDLVSYPFDSTVTLTAIPADPQIPFLGWSGGASGTQNPLTNILTRDTVITATFQPSLIVSNNLDSGPGSLRKAIADSDSGSVHLITFASGLSGSITLTNGPLVLLHDTVILGPGATNLIISGNHSNRVFQIGVGTSPGVPFVAIAGVTIADGAAGVPYQQTGSGGGIINSGTTVISNCVVRNCVAGGSSPSGGSYIQGGGILNGGILTLVGCTFSSNSAVSLFATNGLGDIAVGGGVFNQRLLTALNCTFTGNSAAGGLSRDGFGGAIYTINGRLLLTNCTVASNWVSAADSGTEPGGNAQGGGVYVQDSGLTLKNNLIARNASTPGAGTQPGVGGYQDIYVRPNGQNVTNVGFNLIGTPGQGDGALTLAANDLGGSDALPLDPKLGPLQDNDGPTPTMALLVGSPAIDAGNSAGITIDQRGKARAVVVTAITNGGDGSDIGAFELASLPLQPPTLTVQITGPNTVMISWPSPSTGFNLQETTDASIGAWAAPSESVQDNGTIRYIVVSPPSGERFYRLKYP
jgi:hypothetical protein